LYSDGAKDIELGKIVAIIVENKDDLDAFKNYTQESANAPAAEPEQASAPVVEAAPVATPAASSSPQQ